MAVHNTVAPLGFCAVTVMSAGSDNAGGVVSGFGVDTQAVVPSVTAAVDATNAETKRRSIVSLSPVTEVRGSRAEDPDRGESSMRGFGCQRRCRRSVLTVVPRRY
ncbi:MAG: hypothetical protein M5U19_08970 [Microthrixaceae bacterium]|nr:hypothetical protein [Microthrixaceae bacterium]